MQQAVGIFNRMSENEKIRMRLAVGNQDRLAHLAYTTFDTDLPLVAPAEKLRIITEVQALCVLQFSTNAVREHGAFINH